jgi:GDP-4-dehydro-6-deoxy-D-mannose reductase
MRALITGGFGFVGRHLAQHLAKCGDDIAVTYLPSTSKGAPETTPFETPLPRTAQSIALDVTDADAVSQLISLAQPDAVYHLAAITFVPDGERDFQGVLNTNLLGTKNLLDAIKQHSPQTKVLMVSSAEVYGDPWPGSLPYTEGSVLRPASNYGVSKAAADLLAFKYAHADGLDIVRVRPFPHVGPGQSDRFAISSFARQIAEIKLGRRDSKILVGNLEAKRDYSDVSDIVSGYRDALLNGKRGEAYNLCSGRSVAIGELLQRLIQVSEVQAEVEVDPDRVRPIDIPDLYGSYQKAQKDFGWRPRIELDGTLTSLFAFWVEALSKH